MSAIDDWRAANVLITGASRGVGRELALYLGRVGAQLVVSARSMDALHELADEITSSGGRAPLVVGADLSQRGDPTRLAATALDELDRVDVLVNNAGLLVAGRQGDAGDGDEGRRVLEANYWAPLALAHAVLPGMLRRNRGAIANVSSLAAITPVQRLGYYGASKAALSVSTETLALELRDSAVKVLHVVLGPVDTDLLADSTSLSGTEALARRVPAGSATKAAGIIVRAIERGRARVVYPRFVAPALLLPSLPKVANRWVHHRIGAGPRA